MMLAPEQVFLAVEPVDMRLGIDGLSLLIQQATGRSPCNGTAYAFRNRLSNRLKLLVWDGTGVWLCSRRLHSGRFKWPAAGDTVCPLTNGQWQWLVTGVDWQRLKAPPRLPQCCKTSLRNFGHSSPRATTPCRQAGTPRNRPGH